MVPPSNPTVFADNQPPHTGGGKHDAAAFPRPAPKLDRQVAAWHLLEGLTERAIAQRLGVSQGAVHKRLERIHAHLRQQLEK